MGCSAIFSFKSKRFHPVAPMLECLEYCRHYSQINQIKPIQHRLVRHTHLHAFELPVSPDLLDRERAPAWRNNGVPLRNLHAVLSGCCKPFYNFAASKLDLFYARVCLRSPNGFSMRVCQCFRYMYISMSMRNLPMHSNKKKTKTNSILHRWQPDGGTEPTNTNEQLVCGCCPSPAVAERELLV